MDPLDLFSVYKPIQVSEQRQPPINRPFFFGNQCYIVTEQAVRRIDEFVSMSIGFVTPSGEIKQISPTQHSTLFNVLLNCWHNEVPSASPSQTMLDTLPSIATEKIRIANQKNSSTQTEIHHIAENKNKMESSTSTSQCPITCSKSTSCTELMSNFIGIPLDPSTWHLKLHFCTSGNDNELGIEQQLENKLSARQQLKMRKLRTEQFMQQNETFA